jgi:tetratricopeptide (TPR) repeat protein
MIANEVLPQTVDRVTMLVKRRLHSQGLWPFRPSRAGRPRVPGFRRAARGSGGHAVLIVFVLVFTIACQSTDTTGNRSVRAELLPVALPDLSGTDEVVQTQALERHAALTRRIEDPATPTSELSTAYGEMGMFLHAAESLNFVEPYYLNAQSLAPSDARWPYYLGHLYKSTGEPAKAVQALRRARELRPNDVAILIWLGRLYHEMGQPEEAEPLFSTAISLAPGSVAALAGLGQTALARQDFAAAARHLEQALAVDPEASALHTPLAMAYRGLGDVAKAEAHLKLWRNREILVPDPLREQLDMAVESGLSYELRGVRALESEQWDLAAELFRKGVAITRATTPLGRSLRHKLGTALALRGDVRGALELFEEVVRFAPTDSLDEASAKAYYSLGVLMASAGRGTAAIERFTASLRYNPSYVEAHVGLADAMRRAGRVEASLAHYQEAIRISPRDAAYARFGSALALVRLGRYREARDSLTESLNLHPGHPELAMALARVLSAAPDDRVRDGERALELVKELYKGERTLALGETMAMTFAEVGEYEEAVAVQRGVMDAAQRAGLDEAVQWMQQNLRLYERRQPSRMPWSPNDPVHQPGPPINPTLLTPS